MSFWSGEIAVRPYRSSCSHALAGRVRRACLGRVARAKRNLNEERLAYLRMAVFNASATLAAVIA